MDILKDLKKIIKNDKEHHLKIEVSFDGVRVYLDFDPNQKNRSDCVIPIFYDVSEGFAYLPDNELKDGFRIQEYGIVLQEITLIKEIMEYLESHGEEISELCDGYYCGDR